MKGNGDKPETLLFTCSGAAHAGLVAHRAAVRLKLQGCGNLFCIAAIAAARPDKMDRARSAGKRVAIDGCEDHCCRLILEKAGIPLDHHVVVTDLDIEKQPEDPHPVADMKRVALHVEERLARGEIA